MYKLVYISKNMQGHAKHHEQIISDELHAQTNLACSLLILWCVSFQIQIYSPSASSLLSPSSASSARSLSLSISQHPCHRHEWYHQVDTIILFNLVFCHCFCHPSWFQCLGRKSPWDCVQLMWRNLFGEARHSGHHIVLVHPCSTNCHR